MSEQTSAEFLQSIAGMFSGGERKPLWSDERIEQAASAASTYMADAEWLWKRIYVMGRSDAEILMRQVRDDMQQRIAELEAENKALQEELDFADKACAMYECGGMIPPVVGTVDSETGVIRWQRN